MSVWRAVRPRSFLSLVLIGFVAVAVPLLVAILVASFQVDRLARQSAHALYRTVQLTHGGRSLVDQITSMERSVRQYLILKEESLLAAYDASHGEFQGTITYMLALQDDLTTRRALEALGERESQQYAAIRGQDLDEGRAEETVGMFADLAERADRILAGASAYVTHHVEVMREMASEAQTLLFWQSLAAVPLVVVLAVVFIGLIARPLGQLDHAIRRLGDGELYAPVEVHGPRDLETLAVRLEWLRVRLLELEEEKKSFLRHVSHELKTPLTAVREGAELLAEGVVGPLSDGQREVTEILHNNALRLQKLIEDLLAYSRMPEGRGTDVRRQQVRMDQLIQSVVSDHRLSALARGLAFRVRVVPLTVAGDRARLRGLVDNLVSNAVKYSPPRGKIDIRLDEDPEGVHIEVLDQGPGIAPEERSRVFDPFFQGRVQPGGPVRGTGLGLAIARECAIAHGGEIRIIDDQGQGTHFQVTLPSALVTSRAA
jgi:two-component system sensor histidine kinase GlrK